MKKSSSNSALPMIPVAEPWITERDIALVTEAVRSGWISSAGPFLEQFEHQWAAYCGQTYGIAVSNGTTALQLAVAALGLEPGDEIILPAFTIISCALAIVEAGCVPVLVDIDSQTGCMDAAHVAARITSRTRAIMVVHMYGHPVDMDPILALAEQHGLAIIEDAAEVHGAEYLRHAGTPHASWHRCGSFGTISTFSFYANKLITTGEGGMVLTRDPLLAERLKRGRNLAFLPQRRFYHEELGYNYRLTNLQAALGVAQLERLPEIIDRKRALATRYTQALQSLTTVDLPVQKAWARNVYWVYGLRLRDEFPNTATETMHALAALGIETRPFFLGMHQQPALRKRGLFHNEHYPITDQWAERGFYIPAGIGLSQDHQQRVIEAVRHVCTVSTLTKHAV